MFERMFKEKVFIQLIYLKRGILFVNAKMNVAVIQSYTKKV